MHRRILIVEGVVAFPGGVGVADVWTGSAPNPEHWPETPPVRQGPAGCSPVAVLACCVNSCDGVVGKTAIKTETPHAALGGIALPVNPAG